MKKSVSLVEIIGKSIKIEAKRWDYLKNGFYNKKKGKNDGNFTIC